MTTSTGPESEQPPESTSTTTNVSGGVDVTGKQVAVGGDVVGRDKVTIEHATFTLAAPTTSLSNDEPPAPGEPPFKGLQYFEETDADLFFGREELTRQLAARLRAISFLAIVGASGSGKSSLVRAGLIPLLRREHPHWQIHLITPTTHPIKELAASLTRESESVTATATLIDDLIRDVRSLDLAASKVLKQTQHGERILLIIDQFEELFTACKDESEQRVFVESMMHAVALETSGLTSVVIVLRADFYAHCGRFDQLRQALEQHQAYIGPMTATELRHAIEEPARLTNWQFEPGLVELLLHDVGNEPSVLPLLSQALLATWQRRRGRILTLQGYTEAGGVDSAIARSAESVLTSLSPEHRLIARNIFLRLTELGEGTQDTRRRAALSELALRDDTAATEQVLKTLTDARLITTAEGTAEVAHEALIREWPTLRNWLDEDREGLRLHRQLTQTAQEWQRANRDVDDLYRGARLAQVVEWAELHLGEMNVLEREFLEASHAYAEREAIEREAARQHELEMATQIAEAANKLAEIERQVAIRLRTRNRNLAAGGVIVSIVAIIAIIYAILKPGPPDNVPPEVITNVASAQSILVPAPVTVTIVSEVPAEIQVISYPSQEVAVDTIATGRGAIEATAALNALQSVSTTMQFENGGILIKALPGATAPKGVLLHIRVPHGSSIVVSPPSVGSPATAIDVIIAGEVRNVTAQVSQGNLTVRGATGELNLVTGRGSINVDDRDNQNHTLELHAREGGITLFALNARVNASTTNGSIQFVGTLRKAGGDSNTNTLSEFTAKGTGDVTIALADNLKYRFRVFGGKRVVTEMSWDSEPCGLLMRSDYDFYRRSQATGNTGRIEISGDLTTTNQVQGTIGNGIVFFETNRKIITIFDPPNVPPRSNGPILSNAVGDCGRLTTDNLAVADVDLVVRAESGDIRLIRLKQQK